MQPLTHPLAPDGTVLTEPGPEETWQELAEHSLDRDDLNHPRVTHPPDPAMPAVL